MSSAYKQAGVDIEAGYESVSRMKKHVEQTMRKEVLGGLGSFGGMFDLSQMKVKNPVLVSGTDGVGTKIKLAFMTDRHNTIGIDAVAMCVNDVIVQGAEPLFFLDYIACGKQVPEKIESIVKGVAEGCKQAGCALIGGETAEMPGLYAENEYDLAGFTVGVVEKSQLVTGEKIRPGDVLIGMASSGIHSNGYSLVRKIYFDEAKMDLHTEIEAFGKTLGEELLVPTKIYVKAVLAVLDKVKIKGMSHITGGGFYENIPRMLPMGCGVEISYGSWPILPIFKHMQELAGLKEKDMFNTFNMGIGFVLAVRPKRVEQAMEILQEFGEEPYQIGVVTDTPGVKFSGGSFE